MGKSKAMSREEKLKRKRECEKRRREKIKEDADKQQKLKDLKHQIYLKAKESGRIKMVKDMTAREHRAQRNTWRYNQKSCRKKMLEKVKQMYESPSTSINNNNDEFSDIESIIGDSTMSISSSVSSQKKKGRRIVRKDRASAYRRIKKVEKENILLKRKADKYRKKYSRLLEKYKPAKTDTPKSKLKVFLKGRSVPKDVRKKLLFCETLSCELSERYKSLRKQKDKQFFSKMIAGRIIKKYRFLTSSKSFLSPKLFSSNKSRSDRLIYERCINNKKKNMMKEVKKFLEADDNSTLCPGKHDTITRNGVKKQKRYLNNTLKNLHIKFNATHNVKISYTSFCSLRPFWIVSPDVHKRDTCLCIKHANMKMIVGRLYKLKVLNSSNMDDLIDDLTCKGQNDDCMKRTCQRCKTNKINYSPTDLDVNTSFEKWVTLKEKRVIGKTKSEKIVQKTTKQTIHCTVGDVINVFEDSLKVFLTHEWHVRHQFKAMKRLKENLMETELLFHIDFSENFNCKFAEEAQSVHFGASRDQITLHTGMVYGKDFEEAFCTLSKSLQHDAFAIIAHIKPIIQKYLDKFPSVTVLHFLSDSPSTQYRNKTMFSMISFRLPQFYPNISEITWNYSEAGHGKGAPDGIGAVIKRTADRLVAEGNDVSNFEDLLDVVKKNTSNIVILEITEKSIQEESALYNKNTALPFKGTMKVHQVLWCKSSNNLMFRSASCFSCSAAAKCKHYHIGALSTEINSTGTYYLLQCCILKINI